jgi:hypothetical protein
MRRNDMRLLFLGIACAATTAIAAATAQADTVVPLPNGGTHATTPDGVSVSVARSGERANVSSSMARSPLSRNAWVSGVVSVHVTAPAAVKVTGGTIETGYLVGCQVDLGSNSNANASGDQAETQNNNNSNNSKGGASAGNGNGNIGNGGAAGGGGGNGGSEGGGGAFGGYGGGGGGAGSGLSVGTGDTGVGLGQGGIQPYSDPNLSLSVAPGKVATLKVDSYDFKGLTGVDQYVDHTISVEGCAGRAQARAYATAIVHDNVMDSSTTLWGAPFDIG